MKKSLICLMVIVAMCLLLPGNGFSWGESKILEGVFYDSPVEGLRYETQTLSGVTDNKGEFEFREGESVTFSVGRLVLGSAPAKEFLTPADLVGRVDGVIKKLAHPDPKLTNIARFLQSLDQDGNVENGITITHGTSNVVSHYEYLINFQQSEAAFTADPNVVALFAELGATLRTAAQARNHLRRTMLGIKKMTDVKIPMRDGAYLLADIFLPIKEGKYPVVMSLGVYGKAFVRGCTCNNDELLAKEVVEDRYFEGNPDNTTYENHESPATVDWVPNGYVAVRVDTRGTCAVPGKLWPRSPQEGQDYYDSIEWLAKQKWSNGKVGTWGASYYGNNQFNVAGLQPPSLRAMIPVASDSDAYRDAVFTGGGMFNEAFRVSWWRTMYSCYPTGSQRVIDPRTEPLVDQIGIWYADQFDDPLHYGINGDAYCSADLNKVIVPFWTEVPLEHNSHIHIRGSSESYIHAATSPKLKKLSIITGDFITGWSISKDAFAEQYLPFFDYWLKGKRTPEVMEVMNQPPVKMTVRTGKGGFFWQSEDEWPIDRTRYTKYYLDATPSDWVGDGNRTDFMKLSPTVPGSEKTTSYSADVGQTPSPCWSTGVSFVTEPLREDTLMAGYIKLGMWVSSTSSDMDIHASVRVMDENNHEVPYALQPGRGYYPVGMGWLKVSHRKLDPEKSTIYRPYQTHQAADYAPLSSGQIVLVEIEIWPTTALIKKGHRIRLDVQPAKGCDHGSTFQYIDSYHLGASNAIYTGPAHVSYVQLPIIPPKHHRR